jgi:hypothetical protein
MAYKLTLFSLFIFFFICTFQSCGLINRSHFGIEYAKSELDEALSDTTTQDQILVDTVVSDKETATTVAEAILFKIYDKENIVKQRPYEINFIKGYWIINGTLPMFWQGGTFLIIINSVNGEVIKLTHYK